MRSKSQTPTPTALPSSLVIEPEAVTRLEVKFTQMTTDGTFTGSVLIAQDGKILLSKGYGLADRAQGIPNTPHTRFYLGSMTKQFTAMGILILQSQDMLSVQDSICKYISNCPTEWQKITIHHLLTHTSGLSSQLSDKLYREIEAGISEAVTPKEQTHYLGFTSLWTLDAPPGEQYAYNNFGYILLAHIIEVVSGQSYADYLEQAIFTPLKMRNTGYPNVSSGVARVYTDHDDTIGGQFGTPPVSQGSGYLYSSSEDLYLWDQSLYTNQLLPKSELDQLFEPYVPQIEYPGLSYGYGWILGEFQGQPFLAGAGGGVQSPLGTLLVRYPYARLTVIVLANQYINQFYFWDLITNELF
jgi:CubicO group peptidase (beta-lactamase class C family)